MLVRFLPSLPGRLVVPACIALGLSACGGGSSGSSDTVSVAVGDSFTYEISTTPSGGSTSTSYLTHLMATLGSRQSSRIETSSSGSALLTRTFADTNAQTTTVQGSTTCTRAAASKSTLVTLPAGKLTTGQTWNYSLTETCTTTGQTSTATVIVGTGEVLGVESITTAAGTFSSAVKYRHGEVSLDASGNILSHQSTCWRDPEMSVTLRCDYTDALADASTSTTTTTQGSQVLVGLVVADHPSPVLSLLRFAGAWTLSYSGSDTGTCTVSASASGALSAPSCYSDSSGSYFTLSGSVDANGTVSATGSNGLVLSGSLSSPVLGGGTWVKSTSSSGAWSATHR